METDSNQTRSLCKERLLLRQWTEYDASIILSWTKNKSEFRKWSADRYPNYPATPEDMTQQYDADNIHPLTAEDEEGNIIGHIMIRVPDIKQPQKVRLGFIIVDDSLRGKGYGKQLILQTIEYAKLKLNATHISLGVFLNNPSALHCYESVGFKTIGKESYPIDEEIWEGVEMEYQYLIQ